LVVFYGTSHAVLWAIFVLHGGRVSEEFGTCPVKHMVICCPFYVAACLSMTRFVWDLWILCVHVLLTGALLSSSSHGMAYSIFYGRFSSLAAVICCTAHSGIHVLWKICFLLSQRAMLSIHVSVSV